MVLIRRPSLFKKLLFSYDFGKFFQENRKKTGEEKMFHSKRYLY